MRDVDITIVGAGFSGAMVAVNLARLSSEKRVRLVDGDGSNGLGVAYSTRSTRHLLNVPAGRMSAFPDEPDHFWDWVNANSGEPPISRGTFVPRMTYGRYVRTLLGEARKLRGQLEVSGQKVIAIEPTDPGYRVTDDTGVTFNSAQVVLALGNYPPADLPGLDKSAKLNTSYIRSPWTGDGLSRIGEHDDVLVIGTGLTAIDVLQTLEEKGARGHFHLVSRRGLLPLTHRDGVNPVDCFADHQLPLTIRAMTRLVREEAAKVSASGGDWRAVVDALRPRTQGYWQSLSLSERRRFLRHIRPYWEAHRHRIAPQVMAVTERLESNGQMTCHQARVKQLKPTQDGFEVSLLERTSGRLIRFRVQYVVNCTGPQNDLERLGDPLITQLLATGTISPGPLAMGINSDATGAVINRSGDTLPGLFTIGSPRKGVLYETVAVPELRVQALALAKRLLVRE